MKLELKAKEYDEIQGKINATNTTNTIVLNNNINNNKVLEYGKMIEIFEKRYNKTILEILLEYEDLKR